MFAPVGGVGTLGVVEVDPFGNDPLSLEAFGQFVQIDGLIFEWAPAINASYEGPSGR